MDFIGQGLRRWVVARATIQRGLRNLWYRRFAPMIRLARRKVPQSQYLGGSFTDLAIPECVAATSLGEPLNYLNSGPATRRTIGTVTPASKRIVAHNI